MGWFVPLLSAAASIYSAKKQGDAAKAQANAQNQPTWTQADPWGPSAQYRQDLMGLAMSHLPAPGGNTAYSQTPTRPGTPSASLDVNSFSKIVNADPTLSGEAKAWLIGMAQNGSVQGIADAIPKMRKMSESTRGQLSSMLGLQAPSATPRSRSGGGGGGGGEEGPGSGGGMQGVYESFIRDVLAGNRLEGNPYLDGMVAAMRRNSADQFGPSFLQAELAGRPGGGQHQVFDAAIARGINEAELGLRYQNWDAGRNEQAQILGLGTGYDAQLRSIAQQAKAAAASNALGRAQLNFAKQQWGAEFPYWQMGQVGNLVDQMSRGYGKTVSQGPRTAPAFTQDIFSAGLQGGMAGALGWNWYQQQKQKLDQDQPS